jgi:hypothetical protein
MEMMCLAGKETKMVKNYISYFEQRDARYRDKKLTRDGYTTSRVKHQRKGKE